MLARINIKAITIDFDVIEEVTATPTTCNRSTA